MPKPETNPNKKLILTEEDMHLVREKVEDIKSNLYKTDFKLGKYIDEHFTPAQKESLFGSIDASAGESEVEKKCDEILNQIKEMDAITVKLSFEPTVSFINWLKDIFADNLDNSSLLKIKVDPGLISGVVIEYKGKINDTSIRNAAMKFFEVNSTGGANHV